MKKIVYLLLALIMSFSTFAFVGCNEGGKDTLMIKAAVSGYGSKWIDELAKIYTEKTGNKVTVKTIIKDSNAVISEVTSGTSKFDLCFVEHRVETEYNTEVSTLDKTVYKHPFADLSDIYYENVPGESVTLKDKMLPQVYNYVTTKGDDGRDVQYSVPWMRSLNGIVVNNKVLKKNNYTLNKFPNTTNELFALCDNLVDKTAIVPLTYTSNPMGCYWNQVCDAWLFQYYGTGIMKRYYQGYNMDDPYNESKRYESEIYLSNGLLEAMKVYEKLVNPDNLYVGKTEEQRNNIYLNFTQNQTAFLNDDNNILFMANGLWLEREMQKNYAQGQLDLEFVKVPVVSALGTKLGITDAVLSEIIDYADNGRTGTKPVFTTTKSDEYTTDEIIDIVADARSINSSAYNFHSVVPSYSTKIDMAKEFLQWMATDEGIETMMLSCGGSAAFKTPDSLINDLYTEGKISKFVYSGNKIVNNGTYTFDNMCDLFAKNGLWNYQLESKAMIEAFSNPSKEKRTSPEELWVENWEYVDTMWDSYLATAGISK